MTVDKSDLEARQRVQGWLSHQANACSLMGSAVYGHLMAVAAADVNDGGPCWDVLQHGASERFGNAVPLRFFGAIHRVALRGDAPDLAVHYESCGGSFVDPITSAEALLNTVDTWSSELIDQLNQGVQTNEVQRSAALMPALVHIGRSTGLPIRLLELGTSGGLNLRLDKFFYTGIDGQCCGNADSVLAFGPQFHSPVPLAGAVQIAERAGCDPHPIDPFSTAGYDLLRSFLWPDQTQRHQRLRAAIDIAANYEADVRQSTAIDFLSEQLSTLTPGVATVVMHSIVWQYIDKSERALITALIESAGARASAAAPIVWLTMEPQSSAALFPHVSTRSWPGTGELEHLAEVGFHGEFVRWLN